MERHFKNILLEGDETPKINIVCDVLHEGLRAAFRDVHNKVKRNVLLMHCDASSHIEYDDVLKVYSAYIPYGVVFFMNFVEKNADEVLFDEIVYLEPYPFTLGEKIKMDLDSINKSVKDNSRTHFKITFYRNIYQKSGTGDIIGIDQALKEVPDHIKKIVSDDSILKVIEYCVYKTPKDLIHIAHGGYGSLSACAYACAERYRKYTQKIESTRFFSEYGDYKNVLEFRNYEKFAPLLRPETINRVTKFRKVKGSDDVIKSYAKNYIVEFQDLVLELIEEVYMDIIKEICFWNLEKDVNSLREGAKRVIEKSLLRTSSVKEQCPQFESEYNEKIRNNLKLDTLFAEKAISLINEEMMEYLHTYLIRKEELLSNTFDNWNG